MIQTSSFIDSYTRIVAASLEVYDTQFSKIPKTLAHLNIFSVMRSIHITYICVYVCEDREACYYYFVIVGGLSDFLLQVMMQRSALA